MPSSVIESYTYLPERAVLRIVFLSGAVYEYLNVPEDVYKQMKATVSKGTFLNTCIKGKFPFLKLTKTSV